MSSISSDKDKFVPSFQKNSLASNSIGMQINYWSGDASVCAG